MSRKVDLRCKLPKFECEDILSLQEAKQAAGWEITAFNLPATWNHSQGEGVIIGVIDSGCCLEHPDLVENLVPGKNIINSSKPPEDDNGHGTVVSGIICAANNDIGMVGVAPKAKVMPIKVLDNKGNGNLLNVATGIRWAVDNGANLLCMSLGSPNPIQQVRKAIQYAASKNVIVFCAAGNAGNTRQIFYPAAYPETIGIGSINEDFNRSNFSCTGEDLDFLAPGGKIFSTHLNNWYTVMSGTCLARGSYVYTPHGPQKIENIQPGTIVYAWKSGEIVERPVLFNNYRGKNTVHKIIAAGRGIYATETHELLCINLKNREIEWTKVKDLTENHKLLLPKKIKRKYNEYIDSVLPSDFCWLLGFFLGDGWISDLKRGMRVHFATGEYPRIDDKVKEIYLNHSNKNLKESKYGWNYDDSTKMSMIIQCLGLNHYAKDKTIPDWIWHLSDNKINNFFDGYYNSDGWDIKSKTGIKFGFECCSDELIAKLAILSEYMGWQHSAIQKRDRFAKAPNSKTATWKHSCGITITQKEINGWSYLKSRNQSGFDVASKMGLDAENLFCASWYKKDSIESEEVYDLTVPDADCFVTNGIITHNSMAAPFAVGCAALLLSYKRHKKPELKLETSDDYRQIFKRHTIPSKNPDYAGQKFFEGFGIIDPTSFVKWAEST